MFIIINEMKQIAKIQNYISQHVSELTADYDTNVSLWTTKQNYVENTLGFDTLNSYKTFCLYGIVHEMFVKLKIDSSNDELVDLTYDMLDSMFN